MDLPSAIRAVAERKDLPAHDMAAVMRTIMSGGATQAQIGGFLVGLRMKGETIEEIAAAAQVMRELCAPVRVAPEHLVDTCGTGGDGTGTFNISTASAFVAAAAGARVAKHGNRSVSSRSGSADVLETAGVDLNLTPDQVARCITEVGVGFMFAPNHHGAMKHAIGPRREMGLRTVFNLLGPLTNPANAPNQVLGVYSQSLIEPLAHALHRLGSRHVLVVSSQDGLDEISIGDATHVAELKDGRVRTFSLQPEDVGMQRASLRSIAVAGPEQSLALMRAVFSGEPGPARDIVALNAGAAIYAAGVAESLQDGVARALRSLDSGAAQQKLQALAALTHSFK